MVAGFLSLIPGGLGVRDWILMELLAPHYGASGLGVGHLAAFGLVAVGAAGFGYPICGCVACTQSRARRTADRAHDGPAVVMRRVP